MFCNSGCESLSVWDLLVQNHALFCSIIFPLALGADLSIFPLIFFFLMESLSYESSWESEKFVACPGYCSWELQCQGLNFGGGKATSVGFLGCVRSKLIVLFGEGVHP